MTVRAQLAAHLDEHLPSLFRVIPYAKGLDRIEAKSVVVMVYRERVNPAPQFDRLVNTLRVWILDPRVKPGQVDDSLDDSLDIVLAALDASQLTTWTDAERGLWGDDEYAGYSITCETTTSKEL